MKSIYNISLFLSFLFLTTQLTAQRTIEQDRRLGNFDAIEVSSGIDVYLSQGNNSSLRVVANPDVIDDIITEVAGNKLRIKMKSKTGWNWSKNGEVSKVYITMSTLSELTSSGGSDISGETTFKGNQLDIRTSGGSDVEMELDYDEVIARTSGGSDLELEGSVAIFEVHASGGSDCDARSLEVTDRCFIDASGGSDTNITVNGDLKVSASGASDVHVYGDPKNVQQSSSGASDVYIQ